MIKTALYFLKKAFWISLSMIFLGVSAEVSLSQIQIDSIKTTLSDCPNNGSITVYAKGTNPPLLYSIISGPVTQPGQTGNIFNALPPGNYTLRVSDGLGNMVTGNATITGNYIPLDFSAITTDPYCPGSSDGKIVGNQTYNTGNGPFTWQLIAPSPVTSAPQSSDTFTNLPAGNYTVRLTDACGSFRTMVASLNDPVTTDFIIVGTPRVEIIGCDSGMVTLFMQASLYRFSLTLKFETTNGTYTTSNPTVIDTSNSSGGGYFFIQHIIPGLTYGNFLKVTVTNSCGVEVSTSINYVRSFNFCPSYSYSFKNCVFNSQINFSINNPKCTSINDLFTSIKAPATYEFTDESTNTIVDSGTIPEDPEHKWHTGISFIEIKPVPANKWYRFTIKDGCGNTYTNQYFVTAPVTPPPIINGINIYKQGCLDSTAFAFVHVDKFKTIPSLVMLSGPSRMGSTKPGYTYSDTYSYPDTLPPSGFGATSHRFDITNLSAGTYHFKVIDSCGSEVFGSLVIKPSDVTNFSHQFSYKKGCLGQNQIHYSVNTGNGFMIVRNLTSGANWIKYDVSQTATSTHDSLLNIPSGTYELTYVYQNYFGGTQANASILDCQRIVETITIEGYQTPEILTSNSVKCKGNNNLVLIPDSSKGVPPYQYEIISGPQIFPIQNGNIFPVSTPGIYTARIYDICGNASTKQLFVDTISFASVSAVKNCNNVRIIYPTSDFYTYKWTKPNNTTFVSDSLIISPVTPADTGTYSIVKIININGCQDTLYATHHISFINSFEQNITTCKGNAIIVGSHSYTTTGIYSDTLISAGGCDSIVQLNLTILEYKHTSITRSICQGQSVSIGSVLYNQTGIYVDTLTTATCDSIVTLNLIVSAPAIDLGNDTSICAGAAYMLHAGAGYSSYFWNDDFSDSIKHAITVTDKGKYWIQVKDLNGCIAYDTLEILDVHPLPLVDAGKDTAICYGKSIQLNATGASIYKWMPGGETQPAITVSPASTSSYAVTGYDTHHCGSATDTVIVYVNPKPSKPVFENNYIQHCFEDGPLTIGTNEGSSFFWSTGDTTQSIRIDQEGSYSLLVSDNSGCPATGEILVKELCMPRIFVPDAFSPNGDNLHDQLEIFGKYFKNFEIKIFNRWGEIIFISSERSIQWDGTYRGEDMPIGSYPWIIHYQSIYDDEKENTIRGSVTLIR